MAVGGGGVMFGMFQMIEYQDICNKESVRRGAAETIGLTKCVRCGSCCFRRTCVPEPQEIEPIAEFLTLSVEKLIKNFMVGDLINGHRILRWINYNQKDLTGKFLPADRSYDAGDCIFYNSKLKKCIKLSCINK